MRLTLSQAKPVLREISAKRQSRTLCLLDIIEFYFIAGLYNGHSNYPGNVLTQTTVNHAEGID